MPCEGRDDVEDGVTLNPSHHHVFDLDIFFHAEMRAFAPQAAFLDAAERRDLGGDQPGVDADHAGLQRFGHPPDPAEIARNEIRGVADRRIAVHSDYVALVLSPDTTRITPHVYYHILL